MSGATSESIRAELVEALRLDLVGPDNGHAFARELLGEPPSRWYLTGFLVPTSAPIEKRSDAAADEGMEAGSDLGAADDGDQPEKPAARRGPFPSSIGLTALIPPEAEQLSVTVSWGDYAREGDEAAGQAPDDGPVLPRRKPPAWRRTPRTETVVVQVASGHCRVPVAAGDGLTVIAVTRPVAQRASLPQGTRSVSVFLVNERPDDREEPDPTWAFQTGFEVRSDAPFVPRHDLRGDAEDDPAGEWEERVAALHYRDTFEFAVGHGVSVRQTVGGDGLCRAVATTWIPDAEVERVEPSAIGGAELGMEALGALTDADDAQTRLGGLAAAYRAWIEDRAAEAEGFDAKHAATARDLLQEARGAADRIDAGIATLMDPDALEAFKTANRAMAKAARQREAVRQKKRPEKVPPPTWRPFQLGFILVSLSGMNNRLHLDREVVDLLFFPTGGGKTEAYLGLAAFTMVLRRLRNRGENPPLYAGVSVLMRYTLRLLTLDQLGRAAGLVCALELEREAVPDKLGAWPFEIGLWVGSGATPNRLGGKTYAGPGKEYTAYVKLYRFKTDSKKNPAPIPLQNCPWCGAAFMPDSFRLTPSITKPEDLRVHCVSPACQFSGDRPLPIVTVDEPLYRRLPAFVIATVDKFAALPWTGDTGALFGLVQRWDAKGFYGAACQGQGARLPGPLPSPDLIIQDELHLISGPLGTVAGLYEAAIDHLCARMVDGKRVRPKIVASTATVRRAEKQIRALFEHSRVTIFPPPGIDRRDTFFSITQQREQTPARLYLGVVAPGRSLKVAMLRTYLALLSAGQRLYEREGGDANPNNPVDPYMTLVGYFNSLRELGGSRRIVEDEVVSRLRQYHEHARLEPEDKLFAKRRANYEPVELTSRVTTNEVAEAKERLERMFREKNHVDVALATNMISVGLDIIRLGLMVVLGQPKTSAEYIQATSRVGRDRDRPGLIVTMLSMNKPRDRSHYERFGAYHASFYRSVEPTSVTPFAPRALDRALPAVLVGMCRQGRSEMTPALGAGEILKLRQELHTFADRLAERAANHQDPPEDDGGIVLAEAVRIQAESLLDDWLKINSEFQQKNVRLQYQKEESGSTQRLIYDFLDPEVPGLPAHRRRFRAARSMRDVEPSVEFTVKNLAHDGGETCQSS